MGKGGDGKDWIDGCVEEGGEGKNGGGEIRKEKKWMGQGRPGGEGRNG